MEHFSALTFPDLSDQLTTPSLLKLFFIKDTQTTSSTYNIHVLLKELFKNKELNKNLCTQLEKQHYYRLFVNKVLLVHNHAHHLHIVCNCF